MTTQAHRAQGYGWRKAHARAAQKHATGLTQQHTAARAEGYGELQRLIDSLYKNTKRVSHLDLSIRAEMEDLPADLLEVVDLLPAGTYSRSRMCDQLNSIITAHGWGYVYGTVS